jgi:hypothetical protein
MMIDAVRFSEDSEMQKKYERMAEFLLYLQAENGWFHNFIWHDLSINKTYRTSLAEPNWWSWRAFWALTNFKSHDQQLNERVRKACRRLAENAFELYLDQPHSSELFHGIEIPTSLPLKAAGDQAAVLILGLEAYYRHVDKDDRALKLIEKLADGLLKTQAGKAQNFPYGLFLSWQNMWHAYGNGQAYALLRAGQLLNREDYIESALQEIDHFYPYLMSQNYLAFLSLNKGNGEFGIEKREQYPQIAYGFRPMIWACAEAYKVTGEKKYLNRAEDIADWFNGDNIPGQRMYDPETGRCYDGIISGKEVNKNSGAESTIEALLSLQVFHSITKP